MRSYSIFSFRAILYKKVIKGYEWMINSYECFSKSLKLDFG